MLLRILHDATAAAGTPATRLQGRPPRIKCPISYWRDVGFLDRTPGFSFDAPDGSKYQREEFDEFAERIVDAVPAAILLPACRRRRADLAAILDRPEGSLSGPARWELAKERKRLSKILLLAASYKE